MRTSGPTLRVALIGCGDIACNRHLPVLQAIPGTDVVALADVDGETLRRTAIDVGIDRCYPDHVSLLADAEVDVVAVCTPASAHAEIASAAMKAGKHVFIEKPLALSLDECDRLVDLSGVCPGKVAVGFNLRWHRLLRRAGDRIRQGAMGPLRALRTTFTGDSRYARSASEWRKRRRTGGGALIEMGVHHFDLWRFLLGAEIEEVSAVSCSDEWEDESAAVTARTRDGVLIASVFSESACADHTLSAYGRDGHLAVSCYEFDGLSLSASSRFPGDLRARAKKALQGLRELPGHLLRGGGGDFVASYRSEWEDFLEAIRTGRTPLCTLEDGREATRIALAALAAARDGRTVRTVDAPRSIALGEDRRDD